MLSVTPAAPAPLRRSPRAGARAGTITVALASAREALVTRWLPWLAGEQDIRVLGHPIGDPSQLLSSLRANRPRLLLLDEKFVRSVGERSTRPLRRHFPHVRVVVLSERIRSGLVELCVANRFDGVLTGSVQRDACMKAIRAVDRGELWLPRAQLSRTVRELLGAPTAPAPADSAGTLAARAAASAGDARLTRREAQIVALVCRGLTNKEIGRQLGIMEDTVKKHLQSAYTKLGVHRRTLVVLSGAQHDAPKRA